MKSKGALAVPLFLVNIGGGSCFQARQVTRSIASQRKRLKSSIHADQVTSKMTFDFPALKSIEFELKSALEKARDIDKKYGLCTEPSQQAWSVVDSIYEVYTKMQTFQGDNEAKTKSGDFFELDSHAQC